MNFNLDIEQLDILQSKAKLYSYLGSVLTKTFFKVTGDSFTIMFRGSQGAISTTIPIENDSDQVYYFSTDYSKWCNALLKFSGFNKLLINLTKNKIQLSVPGNPDIISFGIISYDSKSSEAIILNTFIEDKKNEIVNEDFKLDLNDEILENFQLADSLFVAQGDNNSIGLSDKEVIYSDRSVVLKIHLTEQLPMHLFKNLGNESYIFIHNFFLRLFPLLAKTNTNIYFSEDYDTIYWEDEDTGLVLTSESREIAIPSEDEWNGIKPSNTDAVLVMPIGTLRDGLNFFTGFYEETAWKPISFEIEANKSVDLFYRHPTTEINKNLPDISSNYSGSFMVSSEILGKIINKIANRFTDEENIVINFDEDALGVYCTVNNVYEFVLSKLIEFKDA